MEGRLPWLIMPDFDSGEAPADAHELLLVGYIEKKQGKGTQGHCRFF